MAAGSPVLPARPLTVSPPGHGLWPIVGWLAVSLLLLAGFVLIVATPIPDLRADWAIRGTAKAIPQARIEEGKCKTHLVLVECEATLVLRQGRGPEIRQKTNQYFVDIHFGAYTAIVMGDPARPTYLTTNLALDKFWNRVITLAVSIPFFGAIAWFSLLAVVKQFRARAALLRALNGQTLRPVGLLLVGQNQKVWRVANDAPGAPAWEDWKVPRRAEPIVLDPAEQTVLGVTAGDGSVAMPLDAKLTWIGLTDPEREALRRSLSSA